MKCAQNGDKVIVHYIGTLDNGYVFDTRESEDPLQITLGSNELFPALEKEIIGMEPGQVKNILIKAADAYGPRLDENIIEVKRDMFPAEHAPEIKKKISLTFADGSSKTMLIVKVEEETVTLDGNHQLAGLDLTFALKLETIIDRASRHAHA
jgi:FKBP-type peptidyl-prolyl cis-trans isomerase 2